MVFFFKSTAVNPPAILYMGRDKFENEDMLKHGFEEDIWFHVDKHSSAHVYLRLPSPEMTINNIPESLLTDCAQLVKANSIEGNKLDNIAVVYTPWSNLKKTNGMEVGQIGYHNEKNVKRIYVKERVNEIVNRLNKTKEEKVVDFQAEKLAMEKQKRSEKRKEEEVKKKELQKMIDEKRKEQELYTYATLMKESDMKSNQYDEDVDFRSVEDSFM